jgi:hypothetical protein
VRDEPGKRRAFYATRDTVEDLDELRAALGVKKLTVDGSPTGRSSPSGTRSPTPNV